MKDQEQHEFRAKREGSTLCAHGDGTCWAPPNHSIHGTRLVDIPELEVQQTLVLTVRTPFFGTRAHADKAVGTIRRLLQVSLANPDIEVKRADPPT